MAPPPVPDIDITVEMPTGTNPGLDGLVYGAVMGLLVVLALLAAGPKP